MDWTMLLIVIIATDGQDRPWSQRFVFGAVCHGEAVAMARRAAERGWSVRYECQKTIVGDRLPAKEG